MGGWRQSGLSLHYVEARLKARQQNINFPGRLAQRKRFLLPSIYYTYSTKVLMYLLYLYVVLQRYYYGSTQHITKVEGVGKKCPATTAVCDLQVAEPRPKPLLPASLPTA